MMKRIELTQGKYALVDDADFEWLNERKWQYHSKGYAVRTQNKKAILMHREIMDDPEGDIDHRDTAKLNNQRYNLRSCDNSENHMNRGVTTRSTSGVKGVYWDKQKSKWRVQIQCRGKFHFFGHYDDLKKAAKVAKDKYWLLAGEFSRT